VPPINTNVDPELMTYQPRFMYVDPRFYEAVKGDVAAWENPGPMIDHKAAYVVEQFLILENRLVDSNRFEEWLDLFTTDCLYWVPTVTTGVDPTKQLCTAFDDRRRLEDRIVRLRTGTAYSQIPPSRTCRTISNLEVWKSETPGEIRARCAVVIHEWRVGEMRAIPGWYGYVLRHSGGPQAEPSKPTDLRVVRKQVDLVQADVPLRNMTFMI
jgi:3-phenylpropionate/cinnamic acid dioxygenase small subunit